MHALPKWITIEKAVGETPLAALHRLRREKDIPTNTPLAYAGRLDPMASGKLLVLVGDECKRQANYHALDKAYEFEILFGISSDTGDVLGRLTHGESHEKLTIEGISAVCKSLVGSIELPYPHFSSKTIKGKPLHVWTLEGRLSEIEVPVNRSRVYTLTVTDVRNISADELYEHVAKKIETIPQVTEPSKALGADFRREDVRLDWARIRGDKLKPSYRIASCVATVSSGTYIRSLAPLIAERLGTRGLAYSIHRTKIGQYVNMGPFGAWWRTF